MTTKYRRNPQARPCDVCRTVHPNRCKPEEERFVRVALNLPPRVAERLRTLVPTGQRSALIARLIERELS